MKSDKNHHAVSFHVLLGLICIYLAIVQQYKLYKGLSLVLRCVSVRGGESEAGHNEYITAQISVNP